MLAPVNDARFFHALERLMRDRLAAGAAGKAAALGFLLQGPGSELLEVPLFADVTIAQAILFLDGGQGPLEDMKFLGRLPREISDREPIGAALAEALADKAAELAGVIEGRLHEPL